MHTTPASIRSTVLHRLLKLFLSQVGEVVFPCLMNKAGLKNDTINRSLYDSGPNKAWL